MQNFKLIGTWRLESWSESDNRGNIFYPQGALCSGFITFSSDEYLMVISGVENKWFRLLADHRAHDHSHRVNVFSSIISHTGYYRINKDQIVRIVVDSNHHYWRSTCRNSFFRIFGRRMQLSSCAFVKEGTIFVSNMIWTKM